MAKIATNHLSPPSAYGHRIITSSEPRKGLGHDMKLGSCAFKKMASAPLMFGTIWKCTQGAMVGSFIFWKLEATAPARRQPSGRDANKW